MQRTLPGLRRGFYMLGVTLVEGDIRKHGYPPDQQEEAVLTVIEQAEVVAKEWASAA